MTPLLEIPSSPEAAGPKLWGLSSGGEPASADRPEVESDANAEARSDSVFDDLFVDIFAGNVAALDKLAAKEPLDVKKVLKNLESNLTQMAKDVGPQSESDGEVEALPGQEKVVANLREALGKNDVDLRSGTGQQFTKWLQKMHLASVE
jgi:hypothetical protein